MEKIYNLQFKSNAYNYYYGDLTILFTSWKTGFLQVSKGKLDRWDWSKPYENDICTITKSEIIKSKRKMIYATM